MNCLNRKHMDSALVGERDEFDVGGKQTNFATCVCCQLAGEGKSRFLAEANYFISSSLNIIILLIRAGLCESVCLSYSFCNNLTIMLQMQICFGNSKRIVDLWLSARRRVECVLSESM